MRKRRRLANKMTIMVCAVLIAFSAFFYVPIEVEAQESLVLYDDSSVNVNELLSVDNLGSLELGSSSSLDTYGPYYNTDYLLTFPNCTLVDGLESDILYRIEYSIDIDISTSPITPAMRAPTVHFGDKVLWSEYNPNGDLFVSSHSFDYSGVQFFYGSELVNNTFRFDAVVVNMGSQVVVPFSSTFKVDVVSCVPVLNADSDEYQNGYNAGYSAGQTDGYNNGYSQGFVNGEESGFQAGQNSVDTQSYYNAGFSAGYDEGFSDGYSTGFNKGYEEGRNINGSISSPKYLTGYASDLVSGNDFYVGSNSIADVEHFIIGTEIETLRWFDTQLGTVHVDSDINYRIPIASAHGTSVYVEGDGIHQKFSLNLTPYLVHDSVSGTLLKDCSISEVYVVYQGNKYYATLSYGSDDSVNAFFDFYAPLDIGHTVLSNTSHDVHVKMQCSALLANDSGANGHMYTGVFITPKIQFVCRVSDFNYSVYFSDDISGSIIQDQTDEITGSLDSGFNDLTNGFDNSKGDSVNSDLSAGLNEFQTAEDSLFSTASSSLSDYQFFNLSSVPAMVTGMSFVSSIMTSWFNQAGGASGVGIVLSILFSIMLVAMVLGLYRWYQSKGGKD